MEMFKPIWTDVGLCYTFNADDQNLTSTETGKLSHFRSTEVNGSINSFGNYLISKEGYTLFTLLMSV